MIFFKLVKPTLAVFFYLPPTSYPYFTFILLFKLFPCLSQLSQC